MTWTEELDEASVLATKKGYWHIVLFYLLCGLAAIPTSFLVFSQVFINATPKHWCAPPPELRGLELPTDLLRNLTVPGEHEESESCNSYSLNIEELYTLLDDYLIERSEIIKVGDIVTTLKSKAFVAASGKNERLEQLRRVQEAIVATRGEPTSCPHGWQFSTENYKSTLVTEFSLVCDKDWLPRTSNTLFWVGSIFGNLFFGWFSDRYGRRPTILLMILLEVPLAIAASFPGNYWTYIALRVAGGLFFPALYQLPFILSLELMPPSRRTYTGIVVGMLFASGMCLLALLAYLLRDWFYLSLATSLPFILLLGFYWLIPESPRWLVGRGRIADAEKVLRNLAKRNGITLPHGFLIELHKKIKENEDSDVTIVPNGQIQGRDREGYTNRRISNMLPYKPDFRTINETNNEIKESLDKTMTISLDASQNSRRDSEDQNDEMSNSEEFTSLEPHQKPLPADYTSSMNTFRRKSIQMFNKILLKEEEDIVEKKRMDDQNSEGDCEASPLDVFRYPNIRKKFLILTFNWVAIGVVYNSLSYNTPNLGVDDYLAFFIGGAVEIPSYFIALQCMERYGRRWVLCVFMSVGGIACLSCVLVPEAWPWVTVALAMLGRLCAAASFSVFYVQIGELLPTVVRAQAMGASSVIAGIGLLTCPYIVSLASYSKSLPLVIMGVLSVVAGITSLFLPETLNQLLPQTLEDGEAFGRDFKLLSCVNK